MILCQAIDFFFYWSVYYSYVFTFYCTGMMYILILFIFLFDLLFVFMLQYIYSKACLQT